MIEDTITVTKKYSITIVKFDDWVYVHIPSDSGRKEPFFVERPEFEKRVARNKKDPYAWLLKRPYRRGQLSLAHYMVTAGYFKAYYEKGDWGNYQEGNWLEKDPLKEMKKGGEARLLIPTAGEDGYHRRDGKRILRAIRFDQIRSSGYHHLDDVVKILEKHPQITKVHKKEVPWYNQDSSGAHEIIFYYLPKEREFRGWFRGPDKAGGYMGDLEIWYKVVKKLGIKKFERKEDE